MNKCKHGILRGIRILHEDSDVMVIEKSAGILSQELRGKGACEYSVEGALTDYLRKGQWKSSKRAYLVHRLDRETSGVMVVAKNEKAQQWMRDNWNAVTTKTYLTCVEGSLDAGHGVFESYLKEDEKYFVKSVSNPAFGKFARTEWEVVEKTETRTMVRVTLKSGRKNQIRVHFSEAGHPVVGDGKYGHARRGDVLCLHAWKLSFQHPRTGKTLSFTSPAPDWFSKGALEGMPSASARHLSVHGRVNQGSFYTPGRFVELTGEWLKKVGIGEDVTFLDSSCGDGAFFRLVKAYPNNRYLGCDIDAVAAEQCRKNFPFVEATVRNSLLNVSRESFGIGENERLCIVGNPPYNDTTSIVGRSLKSGKSPMDDDVSSRDLGLASLLSYNKLAADYVAVLTPLSYLMKKINFSAAKKFFSNYMMKESIVFSSREFADTSRMSAFPILLALYERCPSNGLKYEDVWKYRFNTLEGESFSLSDRDYVVDKIDKYPHSRRYEPELFFYTMRDVNALMRCRTFIKERCANAVDVNPEKLPFYCYIDVFKRYANVPYWMGNFNVPYIASEFDAISDDVVKLSKSFHPEIFGEVAPPDDAAIECICNYINKVLSY